MKKIALAFALLCCTLLMARAQQKAMYTQYMFNGLAINPAYAAVDESMSITALTRHQWVGFKGAPNTQTISFHTPIKESNTFVGALLMRDQIGEVISETGGYFTLTQRVPIADKSYLAFGANGGISSYRATYSDLYPQSPYSPNDPVFMDESNIRGNFGLGVMLFAKDYYVGISSPHFYYRDISNLTQLTGKATYRPHYMLQAGYLLNLGNDYLLKPNFLMKFVNGSPMEFDMNFNLLIKNTLWLGASYRSLDSFDALASVYLSPDLQLGYSYDFAHTRLSRVQKGSHEIMLQFRLPVKGRDHMACYY